MSFHACLRLKNTLCVNVQTLSSRSAFCWLRCLPWSHGKRCALIATGHLDGVKRSKNRADLSRDSLSTEDGLPLYTWTPHFPSVLLPNTTARHTQPTLFLLPWGFFFLSAIFHLSHFYPSGRSQWSCRYPSGVDVSPDLSTLGWMPPWADKSHVYPILALVTLTVIHMQWSHFPVEQGWANFSWKRPDSKYFRLRRPHTVLHTFFLLHLCILLFLVVCVHVCVYVFSTTF